MQSYCEVQTGKSINWYDRLEELKIIKEEGTLHQRFADYGRLHMQATGDSQQWTTCACGNMCDIIPRSGSVSGGGPGMPLDPELANLGCEFHRLVISENYYSAIECLDKIEKRSAILIREELIKREKAKHVTISTI